MTLEELRHRRDHHARMCADLLHRGHVGAAKRHAATSERFAEAIRSFRLAVPS